MLIKLRMLLFVSIGIISISFLIGCGLQFSDKLIVNRFADALLTKNNELQFRFRINDQILNDHQLYKVKVAIHNDKLAAAIGQREIVYGEEQVINGEFLDAGQRENYIFMDPIPLKKDLHIHELENMIENKNAVSIEVFNNREVFGRAYLTNFSSEL
ncbi:hypothetical protein [Neobacillus niacini]|uniref:hypothetical protein n=1 Tax=Neobacillus niacini TaxID=86668 RepID=UPI00285F3E1A|nr:hypothetical protein [Neobacillus niacini]MDR6998093.1 hypothetical protein [Neobacillus niacini]